MRPLSCCDPCLRDAVRPNKDALSAGHRARISASSPKKISWSVNFDAATLKNFPEKARWDYILQISTTSSDSSTVAVEFHSIEETKVLKKRNDTEAILLSLCDPKPQINRWILVPEGATDGASRITRQKLAQRGIEVSSRQLSL